MIRLEIITPEEPNKCNPRGTNGALDAILFRLYKTEWL